MDDAIKMLQPIKVVMETMRRNVVTIPIMLWKVGVGFARIVERVGVRDETKNNSV